MSNSAMKPSQDAAMRLVNDEMVERRIKRLYSGTVTRYKRKRIKKGWRAHK